jgi:hypothetical protein
MSMNTAVKIAGIVLLIGGLSGCGGSDGSDGATSAPKDASKAGFCKEFNGLYAKLLAGDPKDTSGAIKGIKDWAADMEDYGTPKEMSGAARDGFEVVISTIQGLSDDAKLKDFQNLDDDLSAADNKAAQEFGDWTTENCPKPDVSLPSAGS